MIEIKVDCCPLYRKDNIRQQNNMIFVNVYIRIKLKRKEIVSILDSNLVESTNALLLIKKKVFWMHTAEKLVKKHHTTNLVMEQLN